MGWEGEAWLAGNKQHWIQMLSSRKPGKRLSIFNAQARASGLVSTSLLEMMGKLTVQLPELQVNLLPELTRLVSTNLQGVQLPELQV
mmetsp:Transcript_96032/g.200610  ORF Transcript_96032/g.200610 Transcript_96032/m.200610 type:complete len:87 (+) Transcript_96032:87-347(+)